VKLRAVPFEIARYNSLRNGSTAYHVLFPAVALPPSLAGMTASLTPASGCQNHTLLPYALVPNVPQLGGRYFGVHRNPIPTFGDDGQRPFLGDRMA
jgi:hypothetical protein